MSLSLEGLRDLMRGSEGLPRNMSGTEIKHYAAEVLRRLRRGDNIEILETYLRGIDTSNARHLRGSAGTHHLAQQAHGLFNTTSDGPP